MPPSIQEVPYILDTDQLGVKTHLDIGNVALYILSLQEKFTAKVSSIE